MHHVYIDDDKFDNLKSVLNNQLGYYSDECNRLETIHPDSRPKDYYEFVVGMIEDLSEIASIFEPDGVLVYDTDKNLQ